MLYNVQYLRFIAASLVVLHHVLQFNLRYGHEGTPLQFEAGAVGVDIFFVISGFIMVFITEKKERSPLDFFRHRLARVAPPYWVVTVLLAVAIVLVPEAFSISKFSFPHFLASMFFLPYASPVSPDALPLYVPGWTLNYEFFFYSLFAVALAINAKWRAALASSALILFVLGGTVRPGDILAISFYTNPILLEFAYGMLIGEIVNRGTTARPLASLGLITFGTAGLIAAALYWPIGRISGERFVVWGLPAALLVAGSIFLELRKGARAITWLVILGDASYAIYVTHYIVLSIVFQIWRLIGAPPSLLLISTGFAASIAAGVLFHFAVERPLIAFFSGRHRSSNHSTYPSGHV